MNETYESAGQKSEFGEIAGKIDGANPIVYEKTKCKQQAISSL